MRLSKVHVTHFRSVEDSEPFELDDITCLVGKNEAGKSAILQAMAALNPHPSTPAALDKERDYPRRFLTQYEDRHGKENAVAIYTEWQLDADELAEIAGEVGEGVMKSPTFTISRSYGEQPAYSFNLDFKRSLDHLYSSFKLDASERAMLNTATTPHDLIKIIEALASPTAKQAELLNLVKKWGSLTAKVKALVFEMVPKFMYFSSYDRMSGAVQIEQLQSFTDDDRIELDENRGDRLFLEFLEYAGVPLDEITAVRTFETFNARLQAASNNITDQILEYWTQNPDLEVQVTIVPSKPDDPSPFNAGTIARARVYNQLHRVDTPFSERSAGFVWFFSFLVKFAQVKDDDVPVILLLDEPGLTLHGKAQADLLRFFEEKLAPYHQIVFTTHSPFMVPAHALEKVRVVEDAIDTSSARRKPLGTKVSAEVLTRDPDTLFPLQGALGYEVSQSLFVGENTLLVEGPSDIIYIEAFSQALRRRGRKGLDPRWVVCPSGGIDKIQPFVSLFAGNKLNIAVLSDQAKGDKGKIDRIKKTQILNAGHFFTVAEILGIEEADIEDLLDADILCKAVNEAYSLGDDQKLSPKKLKSSGVSTTRLVKQVEAVFKLLPSETPEFDHFVPAMWLLKNPKSLDVKGSAVDSTLDRAQTVFDKYNSLLS